MNERVLTLYGRLGCPLCDDMAAALAPHLASRVIQLEKVDVDTDPDLKARFGWDVPLLFEGEIEICRHELGAAAWEAWFNKTSTHSL